MVAAYRVAARQNLAAARMRVSMSDVAPKRTKIDGSNRRRSLEDDPAAVVAGAGTEVDDPVGVGHDGLVVLDDDDRLAGIPLTCRAGQAGFRHRRGAIRWWARRGCRPRPISAMAIASLSRCRSPPERVVSGCPRRMYPRPTSFRRWRIATAAGSFASPSEKKASASDTGRSSTSAMFKPPSVYSSTDAWNRLPPQSSQIVITPCIIPRSV